MRDVQLQVVSRCVFIAQKVTESRLAPARDCEEMVVEWKSQVLQTKTYECGREEGVQSFIFKSPFREGGLVGNQQKTKMIN